MFCRWCVCVVCFLVATTLGENETNSTSALNESQSNKTKEHLVVKRIPELPSSVTKPGVFDQGIWFLLFYTPWCEHSQAALPHFVAAVQHIVDHNMTGVSIGKLDISKESGLGKYFNIRSTPLIAIYRDGYRHNYEGEVTTERIISFAVRIIRAGATLVESREQLEGLQRDHPVLFLLVHDSKEDTDWQQVYLKVTRELALRGTFFYTLDPNILEPPPSKLPALFVLKDGEQHRYTGALAGHIMYKWVLTERFPALPTANISSLQQFLVTSDLRKLLVLAVDGDVSQRKIAQKKAHEVVKKLAYSRQLQKSFQFVLTEGKEVAERLLRKTVNSYPQLFSYDTRTGRYHVYQSGAKGFAESAVIEFLRLVVDSKLQPEGGPTYKDQALHLYNLLSALIQATLTHHPYVGTAAGLSMMGVMIFYLVLCCQQYTKRKLPRASRTRAKQLALARRHDTNTTVRHRRHGHNNHSNAQEEDPDTKEESPKDK